MAGAPALSPAALHLDFNDVSIFRVGGQTVSDSMLPVGNSDSSLGPLQVCVSACGRVRACDVLVRWTERIGSPPGRRVGDTHRQFHTIGVRVYVDLASLQKAGRR